MTLAATMVQDFEAARRMMVLGQLEPNTVNDPLLLRAMGEVPRERFLPAALAARAYADESTPLAPGRALLQPMVLGRLVQALLPQPGERALVLGAGTGYGAAVLAAMGLVVTAVEEEAALVEAGRAALDFALPANRPELHAANPAQGWPAGAPYRVILVEGAVETVPEALWTQLGEGGRAALVRAGKGMKGRASLFRRAGGTVSEVPSFDAAAPLLPAFAAPAGFRF
ncbi:protein-L-isoaspartate O-methyltransferase family protein [Roseococcus sp. DSY-14]|uniref:protein-L-isoaspartate O-methyltransferase family protein n=1 Tax=Roseococcus sp. DSY-14 TaxID=3369650 RepID=UPI00387B69DE